ncbi:hypothetical protein [Fodinibacter luteus]|uniref:hypothetical protein n=1 Tax=Fodinibacter luteus TaxID=552064 RepID=UPI0031EC5412
MSIPVIPGYTAGPERTNLATSWKRPPGEYPEQLWPQDYLVGIDPDPSSWLVVEENAHGVANQCGRGCVLIHQGREDSALADTTWVGRDLGDFGVWSTSDGEAGYDDGLTNDDGGVLSEFFVQVRQPSGSTVPQVDVSLPFLWFWDAFSVANGWHYVSASGREHELIRYEVSDQSWKVEVRAQELRTFLKIYRKSALLQVDYVTKVKEGDFARVDDDYNSDWAHFDFYAIADFLMASDRRSMSRVCGQYVVKGLNTARRPRWEEFQSATEYPEFIYGVSPDTGQLLTHTCDPDRLGTYFDETSTRVHYLTPVYFRRAVLQDYVAEPSRYEVTPFHLSCLGLWGVDISINSVGLIEVYLGDIGRKIPHEEWGHWRSHNVPPEGKMEEGRFRRDFLGQWADSPDPIGDLRRARERANDAAAKRFGRPLWRELPSDLGEQYRSLMGPLTDDPSAMIGPLLIIAKVFVDGLDSKLLKEVGGGAGKGEQSLSLLKSLLASLGDEADSSKVLRDLYAVRSRGGVAHLSNSASRAVLVQLGISELGPIAAFEAVVMKVGQSVAVLADLLEQDGASK